MKTSSPSFGPLKYGIIAGEKKNLIISPDARRRHTYIPGGTGAGKSKFMEYLIRQDIVSWPRCRSGLLMIDPHGKLYDDLMRWLAWNNMDRPIVPIDLRRNDCILAYNLLRKRSIVDPAVVVDELLQGFMHVWGRGNSDETPLLARRGKNVFRSLYEKDATLADAPFLLDPEGSPLRRALTSGLSDPMVQRDWNALNRLRPAEFELEFASFINRLFRFIGNPTLRCVFGQPHVSLDLKTLIDQGAIVLVNLATEGGRISKENADLFATLLVSDLWIAAQERGKSNPRPFAMYIDEFQRFLTPTIATNLDEARGFGLALTLANQFPMQLVHAGPHGQRIFDSIMETASNKVVFRMSHEDNLHPLAQWLHLGDLDPDEIKCRMYGTKVLAYREEMRRSRSHSRSQGRGEGEATSDGEADADGWSDCVGDNTSISWTPDALETFETSSSSHSSAVSGSRMRFRGQAKTRTSSEGESESVSETPTIIPLLGKELSHVQFRSLEEQLHRFKAVLWGQPDRHATGRLVGMKSPVSIRIPTVKDPPASAALVERYARKLRRRWSFFLPMAEAMKAIDERERLLQAQFIGEVSEPKTASRRVR